MSKRRNKILESVEQLCKENGVEEYIFIMKNGKYVFDCETLKNKSYMSRLWSIIKNILSDTAKEIF